MVEPVTRRPLLPESLPAWLEAIREAWGEAWLEKLPREVRAFARVPGGTLRAQVMDHTLALLHLWRDGDEYPLWAFYISLVKYGRELGLGLPDLVAALILGRGLLRRKAREAASEARSQWDEALTEAFDGALTLLVQCHESAVEEAVRREMDATEGRLLAILQGSTDGLVVVDPDGRVALWSRGASALLGVGEGEAIGKPIGSCIPPEVIHELPAARHIPGGTRGFEVRLPKEKGRSLDLLVSRTEVPSSGGGPGWASLVFKDVTEVKDLQRELAQSEHLAGLGRLSASVAHEIKNPIAGLRGAMEMISQIHRPDDPRFLIFQEALAQIRRLDTLVKDLLAYAKPVTLNLEPVPVEYLMEAVLPLVRDQMMDAGVDFWMDLPAALPCVLVDPQHITQVFSNLFQNGIQAMNPGGVIEVSAEAHAGEVAIHVADQGGGIPEGLFPKIFQPFFTTKHIGTGLGLSIVQRVLSAHGGRCEGANRPGGGATFSVYLLAASDPCGTEKMRVRPKAESREPEEISPREGR